MYLESIICTGFKWLDVQKMKNLVYVYAVYLTHLNTCVEADEKLNTRLYIYSAIAVSNAFIKC